ncbi:MAG: nucleoside monophosphate kinase [Holosporales bacterium]|jgi:adenylate kinase|nr:nucleoside monophosphate kinase [Holosporales bacterium]
MMFNIQKKIYIFVFLFVLFLAESLSSSLSGVLILTGPPGSGKGHLASFFASNYPCGHISAGDLLREEVNKKTLIGLSIENTIRQGKPVANEVMHSLFRGKVTEEMGKHSLLIIDGFGGQSSEDVPFLRSLLEQEGLSDRTIAVFLESSDEECQKRMEGRLICNHCARVYNVNTCPPKTEILCDVCSKQLIQRPQDTVETIRNRLARYRTVMEPNYLQLTQIFPWVSFDVDHGECTEFYQKLATIIQHFPESMVQNFVKNPGK